MATTQQTNTQVGIGLPGIIFLMFLASKVSGIGLCATWGWLAVFSPLWVPVLLLIAGCLIAGIVSLVGYLVALRKERRAFLHRQRLAGTEG